MINKDKHLNDLDPNLKSCSMEEWKAVEYGYKILEAIRGTTNCCDRCGRPLDGKGYIENLGMKICGICDYEIKNKNQYR